MDDPALLVRHYLLYFIMPLWIAAGLGDYLAHRRTGIEDTSGTKESVLHLLQLTLVGIPILLALTMEINALLLLVMIVALLLHEAVALWDLAYTTPRRYIGPAEQHVHSFMEVLPIMALSFVTILYWNQFLALFGLGDAVARWDLRLKDDPLPGTYLAGLLGAITLFVVVPFGEELWRCLRADHRRRLAATSPRARQAA